MGLISLVDPILDEWRLTPYGQGVLKQIHRAGSEAMFEMIRKYL